MWTQEVHVSTLSSLSDLLFVMHALRQITDSNRTVCMCADVDSDLICCCGPHRKPVAFPRSYGGLLVRASRGSPALPFNQKPCLCTQWWSWTFVVWSVGSPRPLWGTFLRFPAKLRSKVNHCWCLNKHENNTEEHHGSDHLCQHQYS